jgi:hypothetical protein
MPHRFVRYHWSEDDTWLHAELDDDGWALRQVDLRGPRLEPVTAASLAEVLHIRDHQDLAAMRAYEAKYGVLSEGAWDGWQHTGQASGITEAGFEALWAAAREILGSGPGA